MRKLAEVERLLVERFAGSNPMARQRTARPMVVFGFLEAHGCPVASQIELGTAARLLRA